MSEQFEDSGGGRLNDSEMSPHDRANVLAPRFRSRIVPIITGAGGALVSLFLPWLEVARTSGSPSGWTPSTLLALPLVAGLLLAAVTVAHVYAINHNVHPLVVPWLFVANGGAIVLFALLVEVLGSLIPSVGVAVHVGSWTLAVASGPGPWVAGASLIAGGLASRHDDRPRREAIRSRPRLSADRVGLVFAIVGMILVFVGRNTSWISVGWRTWHVGVPSWGLPVLGGELRTVFFLWLVALLTLHWLRLSALIVSMLCAWATLFLATVVHTVSGDLSLRVVDTWLGSTTGHFHTRTGTGLLLTQIGAGVAFAGTLLMLVWLVETTSSRESTP